MDARKKANVPLVIGTAGTCGTNSSVDWMVDITREIAKQKKQKVKVAVVQSSQKNQDVINALRGKKIKSLEPKIRMSEEVVRSCRNIVALAGAEQINKAIDTGADVIIAGRTTDTAIIAALPLQNGCEPGTAWHGAKIAECGALCTTNPKSGVVMVEFGRDSFVVTPMLKGAKATKKTVAAHMIYENSNPFVLTEPGGELDVSDAQYRTDGNSVVVQGGKWKKASKYNVKLEGAKIAGYQTISIVLVRHPKYVKNIKEWCDDIKNKCTKKVREKIKAKKFLMELRIIGLNATLGEWEPNTSGGHEVGVLGIVTAETEDDANEISKILNPFLLHHSIGDDEEPTFAFPFSPPEISRGPVYEFCLNHVMTLNDPMDAFRIRTEKI